MPAGEDVSQERLRGIELVPLLAEVLQVPLDHLGTARLVAMQDQTDRRQAEADALARSNDPQTADVLLGVVAVASIGAIRDHDPFALPVVQDVDGDPDLGGGSSNLHVVMMAP